MKKLISLLMALLLLLSAAALANEYPSIQLEIALSYTPVHTAVQDTIHLVSSTSDEHPATVFILGLPKGWMTCESHTSGAFAAWQSPDGDIHAEFFHPPVPYDHIAVYDMLSSSSPNDMYQYAYDWCEADLLPRLSVIGMEDVHARAYSYVLNDNPCFLYLREDQRALILWEAQYEFGLILWADSDAALPSETLLVEIASTMSIKSPAYYDASEYADKQA